MELDYNKLLDMVSEMGYRLMKSGAEIYRVEESVRHLLGARAGNADDPQPSRRLRC